MNAHALSMIYNKEVAHHEPVYLPEVLPKGSSQAEYDVVNGFYKALTKLHWKKVRYAPAHGGPGHGGDTFYYPGTAPFGAGAKAGEIV